MRWVSIKTSQVHSIKYKFKKKPTVENSVPQVSLS